MDRDLDQALYRHGLLTPGQGNFLVVSAGRLVSPAATLWVGVTSLSEHDAWRATGNMRSRLS